MSAASSFISRLDRVLAKGGLGAVARAVEAGHAGMPADASLMEVPRLIVCLEGTANFSMAGLDSEVRLPSRAGLFVAAGRWVRSEPKQRYVSMGVVFYPQATRFYLIRAQPDEPRVPNAQAPSETWVMPTPIGDTGFALCRLLAGEKPTASSERYFRNAAECLLIAARELLALPVTQEPLGKARFTWQAACDYMAENLHRPLSRKDVARHLRVHPNHLSRLFAEHSHEPFAVFLQNLRLDRAKLLLSDPRLNVAEVARLSGFGSASYFNRLFRARHRATPTRMRR